MALSNILLSFNYKTSIPLRFKDMDAFGHVNNAVFLTYFEMARSSYWREIINWDWNKMGIILAKAEVDFLIPVLLQDELSAYVRTSRIGKSSFDLEYALVKKNGDSEELCATGKTICVSFNYSTQTSTPIPEVYKAKMIEFEGL